MSADPIFAQYLSIGDKDHDSNLPGSGGVFNPINLNPYCYSWNNPLKYIDPTGLVPTTEEAAKIAEHVYKGASGVGEELDGGWKMVDFHQNKTGSLQIGVYSRTNTDGSTEYVVANQGTTMNDMEDWKQNILQPFGFSSDMRESIDFAINFVAQYGESEITFVGHSKGGAEAAGNALATGRGAILFNPMSINADAYGLNVSTYKGNMTAFIVKNEILNLIFGPISKPIDKMQYLPSDQFKPITNHLMPAVHKGLRK